MKKITWIILIGCCALAQSVSVRTEIKVDPKIATLGQKAAVDWKSQVVVAQGIGTAKAGLTEAQAEVRALAAARADAQRILAAAIGGVKVTATTTVKNFELEDDIVRLKIEAFLKGAAPVEGSEVFTKKSDGSYIAKISYSIPMYGPDSLAEVLAPELAQKAEENPPVAADPEVEVVATPALGKVPQKSDPKVNVQESTLPAYTGLIVDARGLNYQPCMAPKILMDNGSEVWGTFTVETDFANDIGIAGFTKSLDEAITLKGRGAPDQLIVKAKKATLSISCNAVVSEADAALILKSNEGSGYLQEYKVTFLF